MLLLLLSAIIITVGLLGNLTIVYASNRRNAIKMDRISLILIEDIAVTDILGILFYYVPSTITISERDWVIGDTMCFIVAFAKFSLSINEILVIVILSFYRNWRLKKPPSAIDPIKSSKIIKTLVLVGVISTLPNFVIIGTRSKQVFDNRIFTCSWSSFYNPDKKILNLIIMAVSLILPMFLIIAVNCVTLVNVAWYSNKAGKRPMPSKNSSIMLGSISAMFILSYVPFFIKVVMKCAKVPLPQWFEACNHFAVSINMISNFFIYFITNTKFRNYLKGDVRWNQAVRAAQVVQAEQAVQVEQVVQGDPPF